MAKEREQIIIPNRLRWYRELKGLSQKDVAVILRLNTTCMISVWENDIVRPGVDWILKLSHLYSTVVEELFCDLSDLHRENIKTSVAQFQNDKETKKTFLDDS